MKHAVVAVLIVAAAVSADGCKKKNPPTPQAKSAQTQNVRFRKPLLISNVGKMEIKTLAIFYNDQGLVVRNLKPGCGVQEVMTPNTTSVEMQFFITYSNGTQIVVPKSIWNFTPDTLTGLIISDGGKVTYRN